MSSKAKSSSNSKSKTIKCKNCRQFILANKMFLHEGFCNRFNIFCEHCEKVFLKKDYENHIKKINNENKEEEQSEQIKNLEENKIENIDKDKSPNTSQGNKGPEYMEIPIQYQINNPIIISGNGQIISNKNKYDFILPYLGINSYQASPNQILSQNFVKEGIDNNFNNYMSKNGNMKNNMNIQNINLFHEETKYENLLEYKSKYNIRNSKEGNSLKTNLLKDNQSKINNTNLNIRSNSSNIDSFNYGNKKSKENSSKIINKNIISYNSYSNLKKIKNYSPEEKPQSKQSKQKNKTNFNPVRTSTIEEIKKFKTIIKKNLFNNKSKPNSKEPSDGESIRMSKNINISSIKEKTDSKTSNNLVNETKTQSLNNKNYMKTGKRCEFCNNIYDDLESHYIICNKKRQKDILSPKKKDTSLLDEKLNNDSSDEVGIDENKKNILLREFKATLHAVKRENNNTSKISNNPQINKGKIIKRFNKKKVEKLKIIKYNFPEDSKRDINFDSRQKMTPLYSEGKIRNGKSTKNHCIKTKYGNVIFNNEMIKPLLYFSDSKRKRKLNSK